MTHLVGGASRRDPVPTFKLLDQMIAVLGSTKTSFWPFLETTGSVVRTYKESVHYFTMTDAGANGFYPVEHAASGVHSLHFLKGDDQHGAGEDSTDFEFAGGGTDDVFSVGAWVWQDVQGAEAAILAKFDVAGTDREWKFSISAANKIYLELYDTSLDDIVSLTGATALTLNQWHFVVATYGGEGGAPGKVGMTLLSYLDSAVETPTIANGGGNVYEDMEGGGTALMLGAADDTAAPTIEFNGRIALPFICGAELTAANVTTLYGLGQKLLGLA